jgi:RNA polymerase sigma-70 factor (ECF subfamily)
MTAETDGDWIRRALERHRDPLLRFAAGLVGPSQAPDVVQDTFVALCKAERKEIEDRLAPWLFHVCKNRAIDLLREQKRLEPMNDDETEESPESGPASRAERRQSLGRMESVVQELPKNQREALLLKFAAGLSYKEIAEVMNLTVSNVGFILHTAIKSVRERLAAEAEPDVARSAQ